MPGHRTMKRKEKEQWKRADGTPGTPEDRKLPVRGGEERQDKRPKERQKSARFGQRTQPLRRTAWREGKRKAPGPGGGQANAGPMGHKSAAKRTQDANDARGVGKVYPVL